MRKFHRLLVGNIGYYPRIANQAGIGGHHAGHIRPDLNAAAGKHAAINGGGIIRTTPSQRSGDALAIGGNKARYHQQWDIGLKIINHLFSGGAEVNLGAAIPGIRNDEFAGILPYILYAPAVQTGGEDPGG